MNKDRLQIINAILQDLRSISNERDGSDYQYAVVENIKFFESLKSVFSYVNWLIEEMPKIDGARLLELNDFPFPKWERELHERLIEMERKEFPGMIALLKNNIVDFVLKNRPETIVDLGSGGMETERQVLKELYAKNYKERLTLIGIDRSGVSNEMAKNNLKEFGNRINILQMDNLDQGLARSINESASSQFTVVLCRNDIFKLNESFQAGYFDLIFYSKFRHHIALKNMKAFDNIVLCAGKKVFELDDYKSWALLIPQSIATWKYPVLMNGAIFSRLRDLTKKEVIERATQLNASAQFSKIGSYLLIC